MLLSVLSFMFLLLFSTFILLQNGIYLQNISFQNIKVKKLYIKWDEKITLNAKEISITKDRSNEDSNVEYEKILQIIKEILPFTSWLKELHVEKILLSDIEGSVKYIDDKEGYLNLTSESFTLNSSLLSKNGSLEIGIKELKSLNKKLKINGNFVINTKKELTFTSFLNITIHDNEKLNLYVHGNTQKLIYELKSDKSIKNTKEIVNIFDLDSNIKYWVYDAIEMSSLSIESFGGWIEYKNLDKAYLNLHAKAAANDLNYTYDQKLAPVKSIKTDLEFKNGVLYIRPKQAYSYDFFLDKSWLKIDFSKKSELLTLHLLFRAQANKDILALLERYKIKLPFVQKKGLIDTDLMLEVDLRTLDVEADGSFYAKEAQIEYLGLDIDISDANVSLKNTHVKVDNMAAKYEDIAAADVSLIFDAKESKGKLAFKFDKIDSKENNLALSILKKPLSATYTITPKGDFISIDKSTWRYKEQIINAEAMRIPFDMKNLKAYIPKTTLDSPNLGLALISGDIFFKPNRADLNIDLLKLHYPDIKLNSPHPSFHLLYKEGAFVLSSKKTILLDINEKTATVENLAFTIMPESIKAKSISLNFDNVIKSTLSLDYNLKNSSGAVNLQNSEIKDDDFGEIFKTDENIELFIEQKNNKTIISSKKHDFEYLNDGSSWIVNANSIEKIFKDSEILKKYDLTNGSFKIEKKENQQNVKFSISSNYKYKFLTTTDKPIESYLINGKYDLNTKNTNLTINNTVYVQIGDKIKIEAQDTGINIKEIINFFNKTENKTDMKKDIKLDFEAINSYLYLTKDKCIISDKINLKYLDGAISAELSHNKGSAFFTLKNDKLYIYGGEFNDEFMNSLFTLSKFKGGSFEFVISGSTKEYSGTMYIKETTILDYKILNNILAFVNTVPSLITFSLPGYNKKGIAAKKTYLSFKFKDDVYNISDIYLESKEIEIVGRGEASIEKDSIDLDLNLRTDLGSSISKIPLVGHILLGEESVSTSLKITGSLENPDVSTQIAKDIAVAPFNIIKRTLMYPFGLFKDDEKSKE
mgnify:CR=1 FL=1